MKILKFIITTLQVIVGFIVKGIIFIYDIVNPPISKSMLIIKNAINDGSNATSILDKDGNQYQYATLSQRLIAHLIDYGVLLIPMGITAIIFPFFAPFLALAFNVAFWSTRGATPGKKFMGLLIIDADGNYLTVERSIIRYLGYIISGIFLAMGFFWIYFDLNNQGWHDKFSKSFVVIENN
jgi:hypothetical protein